MIICQFELILLPPITCNDQVECEQDPGQVHGFELGSEPEGDDGVLVELAPDVHHGHHHRVHQHRDGHEERHDGGQQPVEYQHEEVVGWTAVKDSRLEAQAVTMQ